MSQSNESNRLSTPVNSSLDNLAQRCLIICTILIFLLAFKISLTYTSSSHERKLSLSLPCENSSNSNISSDLKPKGLRELFPENKNQTCVSRVLDEVRNNRELVYFPQAKLLLTTMAKSGTTTLFDWLYRVTIGEGSWPESCQTYVQDIRSPCWKGLAMSVSNMSSEERDEILFKNGEILRVAIQRDPYARLISSFKSKFTCEDEKYRTDTGNRASMVPILRLRARLPASKKNCMDISEFAHALDRCRRRAIAKYEKTNAGFEFLRFLDVHIRPQVYCFNEVRYDAIIDVADLSDKSVMKPLWQRFQYRHDIPMSAGRRHQSTGGSSLTIPDSAAAKLFNFAALSDIAPVKYMPGAEPSND